MLLLRMRKSLNKSETGIVALGFNARFFVKIKITSKFFLKIVLPKWYMKRVFIALGKLTVLYRAFSFVNLLREPDSRFFKVVINSF